MSTYTTFNRLLWNESISSSILQDLFISLNFYVEPNNFELLFNNANLLELIIFIMNVGIYWESNQVLGEWVLYK